jgi:polyhydroxyalkanoate synthesis repressor PhaR
MIMKINNKADNKRIITKYPNRRLYDRTDSHYIPFAGIKELIVNNTPFKVIEDKTGNDVTRVVLVQMIAEESLKNDGIFSEQLLRQIIQFYGNSMGGVMGTYLEKAMGNFLAIHHEVLKNTNISSMSDEFNKLLDHSINRNHKFINEMQALFLAGNDDGKSKTN